MNATLEYERLRDALKSEIEFARSTAAELRARTVHRGWRWQDCGYSLWICSEVRDLDGSDREIPVSWLRICAHDHTVATCAHCGQLWTVFTYDQMEHSGVWTLRGTPQGPTPEGPWCCSEWCLDDLDDATGMTCTRCGEAQATGRDEHGNPSCERCKHP